jgi:hypothetical protein
MSVISLDFCAAYRNILAQQLSIRGARLRWAAGAGTKPTATEGGDPMAHSHVGSVATPGMSHGGMRAS